MALSFHSTPGSLPPPCSLQIEIEMHVDLHACSTPTKNPIRIARRHCKAPPFHYPSSGWQPDGCSSSAISDLAGKSGAAGMPHALFPQLLRRPDPDRSARRLPARLHLHLGTALRISYQMAAVLGYVCTGRRGCAHGVPSDVPRPCDSPRGAHERRSRCQRLRRFARGTGLVVTVPIEGAMLLPGGDGWVFV